MQNSNNIVQNINYGLSAASNKSACVGLRREEGDKFSPADRLLETEVTNHQLSRW